MEFEAEGDKEFIENQKQEFFSLSSGSKKEFKKLQDLSAKDLQEYTYKLEERTIAKMWQKLTDTKNGYAILYQKHKMAQNSALLILGASKYLLNKNELSALMLSKCLKKSGHITSRLDRVLNDYIEDNIIVSKGTKRNRRYSLSQKGFAKALVLAESFIKDKNI